MRKISLLFYFLIITIIISSGKFSCNVGALDETEPKAKTKGTVRIGDALIYNDITIKDVKLNKAYLVFENGERVPDGNIVDFTSPVNLVPLIDSGWTSKNAKVMLGASEKISSEDNAVILNEEDLFSAFPEGLTEEEAGIIGITASISLPEGAPPATFDVYFKVWDKNPGWIYKR
jgi:hypothetical protein